MLGALSYLKFHISENFAKNHLIVLNIFGSFHFKDTLHGTDPGNKTVFLLIKGFHKPLSVD